MSEMEKLAALLSQKKADQEKSQIDAKEEYARWVESLNKLMGQLIDWMSPLTAAGVAAITRTTARKSENPSPTLAGQYDAPYLQVVINGKKITFDPVGRYMLGSHGAVAVQGVNPETALTRLIENNQERWEIHSRPKRGAKWSPQELSEANFTKLIQDNI